jgi:poly(3-hydroxybutyrate) depolymerase
MEMMNRLFVSTALLASLGFVSASAAHNSARPPAERLKGTAVRGEKACLNPPLVRGGGDPNLGGDLRRSVRPTFYAHTIRDIAPICTAQAQ